MNLRGFRSSVMNRNLYKRIFRVSLRIFDEDIELAILIKDARIQQLVFELLT